MACFFRFARAFDYRVRRLDGSVTNEIRAYAVGSTVLVPEAHAVMAEAAGAGERVALELVDRSDARTSARPPGLQR